MRRTPTPVALALLVLANVATAQNVRVRLQAWTEPVLLDTIQVHRQFRAAPAQIYDAVLHAYPALEIPVGQTANTEGIIGSERFKRSRSLAGALLSKSFDCGLGPTGPYADSYQLEIVVVAYVAPSGGGGGGTRLGVSTIASGSDLTGPIRFPKACLSTGRIEKMVFEEVTKRTGG
jgi:hypothetical protein